MEAKSNVTATSGLDESTSPSLLQDITLDKTEGMRNSSSSGLTMREYEEQLKKLTAENFNLKLKVYFVEERLSKVTGINDKEDLIKKNIQLKVTCESQLKELEKKQELLFEASKAFELLQKEHAEEIEKLSKEKDKEISELEEKLSSLDSNYNELKSRIPNFETLTALESELKSIENFEKQILQLESNLREEEEKYKILENLLKDTQLEAESYQLKSQRLENELDQREGRIEELVSEVEQKERDLAAVNFRLRKLEEEIKSKQREEEIMKERIEEKNKTIESLKNSLSLRDESITALENRLAKERSSFQSLQTKMDGFSFQNLRLKEEMEILQSRLRRSTETMSPRGKSRSIDEEFKQKYEEVVQLMSEQEAQYEKQIKQLEEKFVVNITENKNYTELLDKHRKLEDDHKKACTALKSFIKRSSDEKKEREALNQMLKSHEEVITALNAQLEYLKKNRLDLGEKLSHSGTGDNDENFRYAAADKNSCRYGYDAEIKIVREQSEKTEEPGEKFSKCICGMEEKLEKISELEAEIVVLKHQIDERTSRQTEDLDLEKQLLINELETKKCEIENLNGELKRRNINLQEIVNRELWDKNRLIEKLEKRLAKLTEENEALAGAQEEKVQVELVLEATEGDGDVKVEVENKKVATFREETAEICYLLSSRLEELAEFLDSLLTNSEVLSGIGTKKLQDIQQAMEKSRELSKHLSFVNKKNLSESSLMCLTRTFSPVSGYSSFQNDSLAIFMSRDKVISEQTIIINKLREQLKLLNQEIKQRDIELSHCQGDFFLPGDISSDQGIEGQSLSFCQEISDDEEVNEEAVKKKDVEKPPGKLTTEKRGPAQETSESEAWSEPDRSVSLARMGRLEDAQMSHRNSKCDNSSDSSEGTLNENSRSSVKRGRTAELEVRRLQSKIKALDELNGNLVLEINELKNEKKDTSIASRIPKNGEANLMEKLRKTMDRLNECSLTCRQLEEKLAGALERASTSAMELSKAQETISTLEEEICQLKDEISTKTDENEEQAKRLKKLEKKIEEITIESEKKILEAVKQKETAEKKTLEVECRLKDAENISKEVESRVNEIEKKITESKKFKKETVLHFKEAEKHVDTAEKMMEEAERIKLETERKSKDFQSFIDLMRKEVEEKIKEAERKVKKSEKEKEELERTVIKLKKRLIEAEKNKSEVETKVKEGKETIQCMEEKLKELEIAMDQCSEEAQRKIKEMQKKADARVAELEMIVEEREWGRRADVEKKMAEAEKLSRELEIGFRRQLEEAEKRVKKVKENAEAAIKVVQEEAEKQEAELKRRITEIEEEKKEECAELRKQVDEAKLEASELELELTRLTNEKIHLEEELRRMLDKETKETKESKESKESKECRDHREMKGKYEFSLYELENKLTQLALNKSQLASRLEDIETTNFDLVSRISAIRGREMMVVEHEFTALSPPYSPPHSTAAMRNAVGDFEYGNKPYLRQDSVASDPGEQLGIHSGEGFQQSRRNMNSSPDLGIESDPGRFSSLEANQQVQGDQPGIIESKDLSEVKKLEFENAELKRRLVRTRQALEETLTQLSAANQRKKQVERAICKQLHKTHHILKKARVNFESQDGEPAE